MIAGNTVCGCRLLVNKEKDRITRDYKALERELNMKLKMKKKYVTLLVMMLVLALAAGCGNTTNSGNKEQQGKAENKQEATNKQPLKEELVLAIGSEPEEGYDPATGWGMYGSPLFQSTLFKRDNEMKIVNDLATSYDVSNEGKTWTVQLRTDVVFHDGKPLRAEDVKFTYETAAKSGSALDLTNIETIEASGDSVIFHLKAPQSSFQYILATLGIIPEHAYGEQYATHPIGSGPFKFVQWDRGQQLIVEANGDYYGEKPFFKKLTFLFLNEDAAFAAAQNGTTDISYIPSTLSGSKVSGMRLEELQTVDNRGIVFPYLPAGEKNSKGFLIGNDVTSDIAVRKAINIAIDRKALVDGVLNGHGTPAYSSNDGLPWWNSETVFEDGKVEEAKQLLAEAGWVDNGSGIVEKDGVKASFPLIYPANDVTRQSLAIAAADMVKEIGIEMVVEGKSWDMIEQRMHQDAIMMGWGSHDPREMFHIYSSSFAGVDFFNNGHYSNAKADEWMEKALRASSEEEAIPFWQKAQWDGETGFSMQGDAPWAWLVNLTHLYLVNEKLDIGQQRIQPHGHGWPVTDNIEEWKWMK